MNPLIELHNATSAVISANDDWRNAPQAVEIQAPASRSNDMAGRGQPCRHLRHRTGAHRFSRSCLFLARPGQFTAIARGAGSSTGLALLEVYLLE